MTQSIKASGVIRSIQNGTHEDQREAHIIIIIIIIRRVLSVRSRLVLLLSAELRFDDE